MMGQSRDNNVYTRVKRKLVTGATPWGRRTGRPYQQATADLFKSRIVDLFAKGMNTAEIADEVNATEHKVYNTLSRLSQ